ncbi:hypothetical protein DB48_16125 [Shewanella sp. cp20]|nr:hypothetical protein DB48_16125 [Shewanella sp. cp20]
MPISSTSAFNYTGVITLVQANLLLNLPQLSITPIHREYTVTLAEMLLIGKVSTSQSGKSIRLGSQKLKPPITHGRLNASKSTRSTVKNKAASWKAQRRLNNITYVGGKD